MHAFIDHNKLNERQHEILGSLVRQYVLTAEPVGSRTLSKQKGSELSPASIRNVMGDLEELGFVEQPHTSAGRIPTDKGYRYYVDFLMQQEELTLREKQSIEANLAEAREVNAILDVTSRALSEVTCELGIALSPRFQEGIFRKIDFIHLSSNKILMAIALQSGMVKTMTLEVNTELEPRKLASICSIINERFGGRRISEIQDKLDENLNGLDIDEKYLGPIRLFIPSIEQVFENLKQLDLHTGAAAMVLTQPEFMNKAMFQTVMEILEDKKMLIHLLQAREQEQRVCITIGGENEEGRFRSFSIITSSYRIGEVGGTLGVIGPTRMPYPRLISALDYTAKVLEERHKTL